MYSSKLNSYILPKLQGDQKKMTKLIFLFLQYIVIIGYSKQRENLRYENIDILMFKNYIILTVSKNSNWKHV